MKYNLFNRSNELVGGAQYLEDAAGFASILGNGTVIKNDRGCVIWIEGTEEIPASESFDLAAAIMEGRDN